MQLTSGLTFTGGIALASPGFVTADYLAVAGGGDVGGGQSGAYNAGGGGAGGSRTNGSAGETNRGAGGSSAGPINTATQFTGGNGGSGVVILRTLSTAVSTTGSPTITTDGSYNVYAFTGSGSITF